MLALPATSETTGIISKDKIELMKQNAFIVYVGRGCTIDQNALINALMTKRIAGAGLDFIVSAHL